MFKNFVVMTMLISSINYMGCSTKKDTTESTDEEKVEKNKIQLVRNDAEKKVDVLVDGELFTSYIYPDNIKKPVEIIRRVRSKKRA